MVNSLISYLLSVFLVTLIAAWIRRDISNHNLNSQLIWFVRHLVWGIKIDDLKIDLIEEEAERFLRRRLKGKERRRVVAKLKQLIAKKERIKLLTEKRRYTNLRATLIEIEQDLSKKLDE